MFERGHHWGGCKGIGHLGHSPEPTLGVCFVVWSRKVEDSLSVGGGRLNSCGCDLETQVLRCPGKNEMFLGLTKLHSDPRYPGTGMLGETVATLCHPRDECHLCSVVASPAPSVAGLVCLCTHHPLI